jgi:hypothetical protein
VGKVSGAASDRDSTCPSLPVVMEDMDEEGILSMLIAVKKEK